MTDSATLARHLERNPHNIRGYNGTGHFSAHDMTAARLEDEGRRGFPHGVNPYAFGTMAYTRWLAGWHQAATA